MRPHVYDHVAPTYRPLLDLLVTPITLDEVAVAMKATRRVVEYRSHAVCGALGLERDKGGPQYTWRIAVTRMYFGIDSCWCGHGESASEAA